jgi:hypothetical protein
MKFFAGGPLTDTALPVSSEITDKFCTFGFFFGSFFGALFRAFVGPWSRCLGAETTRINRRKKTPTVYDCSC